MWLVVLTIVNALLSLFGSRVMRFSALDISPVGIAIVVLNGGSVLLGSLVLVVTHILFTPREVKYLWIMLPTTILVGYLAFLIKNLFILLLIYHVVGFLAAWIFQYFNGRYLLFIFTNVAVNLMLARIYGFF